MRIYHITCLRKLLSINSSPKSQDRPVSFCTSSITSKNLQRDSKGQADWVIHTHRASQGQCQAQALGTVQGWEHGYTPLLELLHYKHFHPGVTSSPSGHDKLNEKSHFLSHHLNEKGANIKMGAIVFTSPWAPLLITNLRTTGLLWHLYGVWKLSCNLRQAVPESDFSASAL